MIDQPFRGRCVAGPMLRRDRFAWSAKLALLVTLMPAGCVLPTAPETPTEAPTRIEPAVAFSYPSEPPVVDVAGLQTLVRGFKGRLVLLDFWGSWSGESLAGLADLASLQQRWGSEDVQIISCNLDPVGQWRGAVLPALRAAGANYPCVVVRSDAKPALRQWLDPSWTYAVPARFIVDADGQVTERIAVDGARGNLRAELRRCLVEAAGPKSRRLPPGSVSLRLTLIDVRNGRSSCLGSVVAVAGNATALADLAAEQMSASVDRRNNPRMAVLPFTSGADQADPLGEEAARRLVEALRRRGYQDLVTPGRAGRMMADAGVGVLAVEFEPELARGRLPCDYLVVGRLQGTPDGQALRRVPPPTAEPTE